MTLCPFATQEPISTNTGGSMGDIYGLVVHVQEGAGDLHGWFDNPASGVSAHFWVSTAGQLVQYVPVGTVAWAQADGNANYVSVETEGFDQALLTPEQVATVGRLFAWLRATYPTIPADTCDHGGRGLTTHAHYPSGVPDPAWGGHPCPGNLRSSQLPDILAAAAGPTPAPNGANMLIRDTVTGGYWVADSTGAVYAYPSGPGRPVPPYLGGVNNPQTNPQGFPCVGICDDGAGGYTLCLDFGESSGGDRFRFYHFPRPA